MAKVKEKRKNENGQAAPAQDMPQSFIIKDDEIVGIPGGEFTGLTGAIKALPYTALQETAAGQEVLGRLQKIAIDHYNKTKSGDKK